MKYIITEEPNSFPPYIVRIFPACEQHSLIAEEVKGKIIGAGFCCVATDMLKDTWRALAGIEEVGPQWVCYGESTSLNITSRGDADATILNALASPVDKSFDLNSRAKSQR
jgi:hypothetical protein